MARSVLLDSDGGGQYRQLYSRAFDRRFFFEIVERAGYRAFGAQAPISFPRRRGSGRS